MTSARAAQSARERHHTATPNTAAPTSTMIALSASAMVVMAGPNGVKRFPAGAGSARAPALPHWMVPTFRFWITEFVVVTSMPVMMHGSYVAVEQSIDADFMTVLTSRFAQQGG